MSRRPTQSIPGREIWRNAEAVLSCHYEVSSKGRLRLEATPRELVQPELVKGRKALRFRVFLPGVGRFSISPVRLHMLMFPDLEKLPVEKIAQMYGIKMAPRGEGRAISRSRVIGDRRCALCGRKFGVRANYPQQKFCCRGCAVRAKAGFIPGEEI